MSESPSTSPQGGRARSADASARQIGTCNILCTPDLPRPRAPVWFLASKMDREGQTDREVGAQSHGPLVGSRVTEDLLCLLHTSIRGAREPDPSSVSRRLLRADVVRTPLRPCAGAGGHPPGKEGGLRRRGGAPPRRIHATMKLERRPPAKLKKERAHGTCLSTSLLGAEGSMNEHRRRTKRSPAGTGDGSGNAARSPSGAAPSWRGARRNGLHPERTERKFGPARSRSWRSSTGGRGPASARGSHPNSTRGRSG